MNYTNVHKYQSYNIIFLVFIKYRLFIDLSLILCFYLLTNDHAKPGYTEQASLE